ncbi:sterol desaturase family protein [Calothrix sp. PCC 6303]|uniref:sterol desaturase family protein n=1 Tax=Calothrix sp. PCC 6303 TaxID=1170562 RepID=UPI0002A024A3|nr:sterol desaturase family protein [Calothrix sp. PCC 6303]AFZ00883.1 fatty acid hydroxylase [Calothrix sp. PCC 6303]
MDLPDLTLIISILLFISLENTFPFFKFRSSFSQRTYPNLLLAIINITLSNFSLVVLLNWIWQQNSWYGLLNWIQLPWVAAVISFLVLDLYMYWWHRLIHIFPLGWRFHQVHHVEMSMNTSTAYKFHPIEVLMSGLPKLLLIWFLGIKPNYLLFYEVILSVGLIFHHSNWSIPWKLDKYLSYLIVTPNYHRLHHSQSIKDSQSNYASFFTIWDRVFKSYRYPRYPEKIQLGLFEYNQDLDIVKLIFLPFKNHRFFDKMHPKL